MSKFHRGFKGEFKFLREEFEFFVLVSSVITFCRTQLKVPNVSAVDGNTCIHRWFVHYFFRPYTDNLLA